MKPHRSYRVPEIVLILLIASVSVSAVNGPGLLDWAEQIESPQAKRLFVGMFEPLADFSRMSRFYEPLAKASGLFQSMIGSELVTEVELEGALIPQIRVEEECSSMTIPGMAGYRSELFFFSARNPLRVLMIGDSMANCFKLALRPYLDSHEEIDGELYGIQSTNLSELSFGNWLEKVPEIFERDGGFDLVLIFLGANAAQLIATEEGEFYWDSPRWREIYSDRVQRLIGLFTQRGTRVYWPAVPPMRLEGYKDRMVRQNEIIREIVESEGGVFVPVKEAVGDENGLYTTYKVLEGVQTRIRTEDGIHYTREGSALVLETILDQIREDFSLLER